MGFYYGTSSEPTSGDWVNATSSSFSLDLNGLKSNTKYYYRACVKVTGTGSYASQVDTFYGDVKSFTTPAESVDVPSNPAVNAGWLELPGDPNAGDGDNFVSYFKVGSARNYSYMYDKSMYTSMWTAYPLYSSVMSGDYSASWKPNPNLEESEQIDIWSGSYGVEDYSRGHLLPKASRSNNSEMLKQAYYATNQVPQIQVSFNGGIWQSLETAVRNEVNSDTLYVVTGVAFRKVGGSESVKYIKPQYDTKQCPVPNYFYKVVMKVKRSAGKVTAASTVGFWFEHKTYSGSYTNHAVSVNQIEQWTGVDFFVNLPDSIENNAETNSDWETFTRF